MPEFEEPKAEPSAKQNYTPSTDASQKPRTRRRSGGFKTTPAVTDSSIGEIDPAEALKKEKLSGGAKPEPKPKKKKSAPKADKPKAKADKPDANRGNPQPSPETLAAIQRVDARLAERKKARDARRAEKEKNRPAKGSKNPVGKKPGSGKKPQSGGLIASILNFFGLGPKPPAKKPGGRGKPAGNQGQGGGKPRGKSGNRGQGQNRSGGGKGRRSGGKGQRQSRRSPNKSSS